MKNFDLVLWVVAFVLFAISIFWSPPRGNLVSAGLACAALTFIV